MAMSKKDFIALADHLRYYLDNNPDFTKKQRTLVIDIMAGFCQQQNCRFMRGHWLAYLAGECGSNGGAIRKGRAA